MHCYELEINVLFGFIKMADEMGFKPQWWFDRKKAQQENGIWIKSKFKKIKKNEPKREVEKSLMLKKKSKLLSKSLLWDSEACDLTEFFGHHNSSLCATRANVQCILKKY